MFRRPIKSLKKPVVQKRLPKSVEPEEELEEASEIESPESSSSKEKEHPLFQTLIDLGKELSRNFDYYYNLETSGKKAPKNYNKVLTDNYYKKSIDAINSSNNYQELKDTLSIQKDRRLHEAILKRLESIEEEQPTFPFANEKHLPFEEEQIKSSAAKGKGKAIEPLKAINIPSPVYKPLQKAPMPAPQISPQEEAQNRIQARRPVEMSLWLPLDQATSIRQKYIDDLRNKVLQNDPTADVFANTQIPSDEHQRNVALFGLQNKLENLYDTQEQAKGVAPQKMSVFSPEESSLALKAHTKNLIEQQKPEEAVQFLEKVTTEAPTPQTVAAAQSLVSQIKGESRPDPDLLPLPNWLGFEASKDPEAEFKPVPKQATKAPAPLAPAAPAQPHPAPAAPHKPVKHIPIVQQIIRRQMERPDLIAMNPYLNRLAQGEGLPGMPVYVPYQKRPTPTQKVMQYFEDYMFDPERYPEEGDFD
jgi:hypothetical protein